LRNFGRLSNGNSLLLQFVVGVFERGEDRRRPPTQVEAMKHVFSLLAICASHPWRKA